MTEGKARAILDLLGLIRQRRAEIDPALLEKARAALGMGAPETDGVRAGKAVELFLKNHPEPTRLRAALLSVLKHKDS